MNVSRSGHRTGPVSALAPRRVWMFRLLSVTLGLGSLVLLELICIAAGWGDSQTGDDPLVGFESIRPLFELTADGSEFHTSPARRGYFKEVTFAARKPSTEFRIFVFGGSTVQGNPFSIETSFPTYLQIGLGQADPSKQWKVVNCGGVSYASYRLLPIMQECLGYEPDLYIFCGGHNQFLEHISFQDVRRSAAITGPVVSVASRLRTYRILQRAIKGDSNGGTNDAVPPLSNRAILPGEVDAMLDHDGGLARYHRNDEQAESIAQIFGDDLRAMCTISYQGSIPLLLVTPPSNLSDCPPFKSEFSTETSVADQKKVLTLLKQAMEIAGSDSAQGESLLKEAAKLDARYALTWYELGQLQQVNHDYLNALDSFIRARDEDVCPLRMTSPLETTMQNVSLSEGVPRIDAHALLARRCPHQIVGDAVLVDHVHPSFRSHEDIAIAIAEWMMESGLAAENNPTWKEDTVQECRRRLQALDDLYFLRGQRALRSLRIWAAGRAAETPTVPTSELTDRNPE